MKFRWYILIIVGVLILTGRILLPHFVLRYVNRTLDDLKKYSGSVQGVDVNLCRGRMWFIR